MSKRRDYHRYSPWMGHALTAACLFFAVALFAKGHLLHGAFWGVIAVISAATNRIDRH